MKKSFILYNDQEKLFDQLTDAEAGILIKAIFKSNHSKVELKDRMLQILLTTVLQQIDRDAIKYADKCKKLRENGSKGGKARAENVKQMQANVSLNDNDNNNPTEKEFSVWVTQYANDKNLPLQTCLEQGAKAFAYYNKCMNDLNKRTWHDSKGNKINNWKLKVARVWFSDILPNQEVKINTLNVC
jgi:hypothetical protein